jgi:hypothetical protein
MTTKPSTHFHDAGSPRWLLLLGALASAILFVAFLMGVFGMFRVGSLLGRNWLTVLFDLNFRSNSTPDTALSGFSLVDFVLMLLFGFVMVAMYPIFARRSKPWAAIAVALPFLGILVFSITSVAGRSAVLLAGRVSSILALRSRFGSPLSAIAGMVASFLLLVVGDFGTAALPPSILIAVGIGVGYLLWMVWFLLVAMEFARRARREAG